MRFGLGATVARVATNIRTFGVSFLRNNLKLFFDFKNTDLEHVGIGSCQFEGADDEIQIADHANLDGMDQLTIMCWFKYDSTCDNGGNLISKEHDDAYQLQVDTSNNRVQFFVNNVSDSSSVSGISINTWHHVTCTYTSEGSGTSKIYIDGVLDQTDTTFSGSTVGTNSHPLYLGGDVNSSTNFGGLMKNVGIWNRVLSDSEIQNIIYKTYSDLRGTETTGLLAWYPLESNGNDSTGNHNGTASGDITFHTSIYGGKTPTKPRGVDNSSAALADQIGNGSASFDGTDDYINCGDSDSFSFGDGSSDSAFSVTAWIKMDSATKFRIIGKTEFDTKMEWLFGTDADDDLRLVLYDSTTSNFISQKTDAVLVAGQWYHLAATYSGNEANTGIILYVDGVIAASTGSNTGSYTAMHSTSAPVMMGQAQYSSSTTDNADGNIAQVGVFNAVLTQEQIQSISQKQYSELTTSEKTNLVSWWGLDSSLTGQNLSITLDSNNTTTTTKSLENTSITHSTTTATKITADALTEGKVYKIVFTKTNVNTSGYCNLSHQQIGAGATAIMNITSLSGTLTFYYRALVSGRHLTIQSGGGGTQWAGTVDNISVEEYDGNPGELL